MTFASKYTVMINPEKKLQPVRDIIYDYIYITPIEKHVIDTPTFQRLRFISQNSAAYMTYPSNQLSRFSHSMGVMHLGGKMFLSAIQNSSPQIAESFLNDSKSFLSDFFRTKEFSYDEVRSEWLLQFGNICKINVTSLSEKNDDDLFISNFLWQTVRIACLIHDIGHLPYSHLFEYALVNYDERYNKTISSNIKDDCIKAILSQDSKINDIDTKKLLEDGAIHELLGIQILSKVKELLQGSSHEGGFSKSTLITRYIFELSVKIFAYNGGAEIDLKDRILGCLHSIISSDLDADRLDYTLRDARVSGINVSFDYNRILNNIVIYKSKTEGFYKVFVSDKALSSLEQFFHARYLCYEYIYFHHNVARFDGILEEIIIELLSMMDKSDEGLCKILEEYYFYTYVNGEKKIFGLKRENDKILRFEYYDDYWLRGLLQKVRHYLHDKVAANEDYKRIHLLCSTFLFRRTENIISLLKKQSDVDEYLENYYLYLQKERPEINAFFQEVFQIRQGLSISPENETNIQKFRFLFSQTVQFKREIHKNISKLRNDLKENGIILVYKSLKPRVIDKKTAILSKGVPKACVELSPYMKLFEQVPMYSFQHFFCFVKENIKSSEGAIEICKIKTFECLTEILTQMILVQINTLIKNIPLSKVSSDKKKEYLHTLNNFQTI